MRAFSSVGNHIHDDVVMDVVDTGRLERLRFDVSSSAPHAVDKKTPTAKTPCKERAITSL
jgi:hypothetical protein